MGKSFVAFVVGAAAGAAATWFYAKKYFGDIVEDTVRKCNAVEAEEQPKMNRQDDEEDTSSSDASDEPKKEADGRVLYNKAIKDSGYSDKASEKKPYVITAEEYRDGDMLTSVSWSYYEDGVVTDEYDNIVDDVEQAIGEDFVEAFGDDDVAYVRNEDRHCDYEIVREWCRYKDPPDAEE